ncbi:MAG: PD-(D/E)XK nuclease family protein, partial [Ignavibacteria bacterium]|nr:PD-(D/E)XK nuclease family protein [Ignavibacteria bacterium]
MKEVSPQCIKIGVVEGEEGLLEISISKAKKWQSCQKAFAYRYNDKLRPKKKATALRRGTWVHSCLEQRALGNDWVKVIKDLKAQEYDKLFLEEKVELGDLPTEVFRMMRAYHQTYLKVDAEYETVRAEQDFMIRVPGTKIVLVGKIDAIIRHRVSRKVWIVEHKTVGKDIPSEDYRMSDGQTAVYSWVLEQIAPILGFKPGDVAGVLMDYIKTKPPTIPDMLKNGTMSRRRISCDRYTY